MTTSSAATMEQENNNGSSLSSSSSSSPNNSTNYFWLLLPQALVGLVDAISMMVVAPSVVFYVYSLGGTKEQYGIILSVFSFSSFLFKPLLGYWCDEAGFVRPYLWTLAAASLGGLLYFVATAFTGFTAICLLFVGRFLGGIGAANSTLGFTYVAEVIPHDKMTKMSSLLSMVRVLGMVAAPGMNVFLARVKFSMGSIQVNALNSVGLFLLLANVASFFVILFLLEEPPKQRDDDDEDDDDPKNAVASSSTNADANKKKGIWKSMFSLGILLPNLNILTLNANFQLMETGLAPAASNVLGWGPVAISTMFGVNSILIFVLIVVTFQLANKGVSDMNMLITGLILSTAGYSLLYFCWQQGASLWEFLLPFLLATSGFPFLGAPTRSLYTKAIDANPQLRHHQGTMQAIMSMAASVAGFAAPGLIAAFVLRTPEQVAASADQREFTAWALFAPVFSILVLAGFLYLDCCVQDTTEPASSAVQDVDWDKVVQEGDDDDQPQQQQQQQQQQEPMIISERTKLLAGGILPHNALEITRPHRRFDSRTEAHRRHSVTLMGVPQISFQRDDGAGADADATTTTRRPKVTRHTMAV